MPKQEVRLELFYDGTWHNLVTSDDVLAEQVITITRGQGDASPALRPASVVARLANDDDLYRVDNPESPLYGKAGRNTPLRIYVGGSVRAQVAVNSFEADQSPDFRRYPRRGKAWVDISGGGIAAQVNQWRQKLRSALYRGVKFGGVVPAEWWPMEDPAGSSQASSAVGQSNPMLPVAGVRYTLPSGAPVAPGGAPDFGRGAGISGSDLLPSFQGGGTLTAPIRSATFNGYAIDWVMKFQAGATPAPASVDVLSWRESGTYCQFVVNVDATSITVFHATPASLATLSFVGAATAVMDLYDGVGHHFRYQVRQNGANYSATLYRDSAAIATAETYATPGLMAGTVGAPTGIEWNPGEDSGDYMMTEAGHLIVWPSGQLGDQPPIFYDLNGRALERTSYRIGRILNGEEGINCILSAGFNSSSQMGPQRPDSLPDLLAEIIATEDGLLFDRRNQISLVWTARADRYNQTPKVDLRPEDFAQLPKEVAAAADVHNVIIAAQREGGDYTARDDTGPLGTQPPPAGVGEYEQRVDVNIYDEADLPQYAGYWLRRGTVNLPRYPRVTINLAALPAARVAQIETLDIGDVFTITAFRENVIRLHVLGYVETIGTHTRTITYSCASDQQFDIGTYDSPDRRYDLGTSTIATAAGPTDTTLALAITADESWSTVSAYDLMIAGELIGVPAGGAGARGGSAGAYTQTLTGVTRSKNGIRKTLPAGSMVRVATPGRYGLKKDWTP